MTLVGGPYSIGFNWGGHVKERLLPVGFGREARRAGGPDQALERLGQLRSDMPHVAATIRIVDPAFQLDGTCPGCGGQGATGSARAS